MAIRNQIISRDSADALREFSDEFRSALVLGDFVSWAATFGHLRTTDALETTFPIPLSAAGYKELKGDITFRAIFERSLTMISKEFFDGVSAKAAFVESDKFSDWNGEPARIAAEWMRFPQIKVAELLASSSFNGPLLDFYRDPDSQTASARRLFATDHPFNVLDPSVGSFNNTITCVRADIASGDLVKKVAAYFRSIKGPNGQDLGLSFGGGSFLAPTLFENDLKELTQQDNLIRAVLNVAKTDNVAAVVQNNIWGKTVSYELGVELARPAAGTVGDYMYATCKPKPGLYPWVVQQAGTPEEILHDRTSEMYKRSLEIGVAYVGRMNVAGCLPHPIVRINVTDSNP